MRDSITEKMGRRALKKRRVLKGKGYFLNGNVLKRHVLMRRPLVSRVYFPRDGAQRHLRPRDLLVRQARRNEIFSLVGECGCRSDGRTGGACDYYGDRGVFCTFRCCGVVFASWVVSRSVLRSSGAAFPRGFHRGRLIDLLTFQGLFPPPQG